MKNQSIEEMTSEEYREKLNQIFNEITDIRALRFFYKFVSGMVVNAPCIFEKGEE